MFGPEKVDVSGGLSVREGREQKSVLFFVLFFSQHSIGVCGPDFNGVVSERTIYHQIDSRRLQRNTEGEENLIQL